MPWVHGDWIDDEESLARAPSRWRFDPYVRLVFEQAGWQPLPPPAPSAAGDAQAYARALLEEFGGLRLLGSDDEGYAVEFFTEPLPIPESEVALSPFLAGSEVIAQLSRGYVVLIVDGRGGLYTTDDVIGGLNSLGDDFSAAADMLVRGQPCLPNLRGWLAVSGHEPTVANGRLGVVHFGATSDLQIR